MGRQRYCQPEEALRDVDERCILAVRGIKRFGFRAASILKDHFSQFGQICRVCIATCKVRGQQLRPGNYGLVWMIDRQSTATILDIGTAQTIREIHVWVEPYRHNAEEAVDQHGQDSTEKLENVCCTDSQLAGLVDSFECMSANEHKNAMTLKAGVNQSVLQCSMQVAAEHPEQTYASQRLQIQSPSHTSSRQCLAEGMVVKEQHLDVICPSFRSNLASCLTNLARWARRCEQGSLVSTEELLWIRDNARLAYQGLGVFVQLHNVGNACSAAPQSIP